MQILLGENLWLKARLLILLSQRGHSVLESSLCLLLTEQPHWEENWLRKLVWFAPGRLTPAHSRLQLLVRVLCKDGSRFHVRRRARLNPTSSESPRKMQKAWNNHACCVGTFLLASIKPLTYLIIVGRYFFCLSDRCTELRHPAFTVLMRCDVSDICDFELLPIGPR